MCIGISCGYSHSLFFFFFFLSLLPQHLLKLKCCSMSTEIVGLLGTGAKDGHLGFHTAPELCVCVCVCACACVCVCVCECACRSLQIN